MCLRLTLPSASSSLTPASLPPRYTSKPSQKHLSTEVQPFNFNATSGFNLSSPQCLCLSATHVHLHVHSCGHSLVTRHTRSFSPPVPTSLYKCGRYSKEFYVIKKLKQNVFFFLAGNRRQRANCALFWSCREFNDTHFCEPHSLSGFQDAAYVSENVMFITPV